MTGTVEPEHHQAARWSAFPLPVVDALLARARSDDDEDHFAHLGLRVLEGLIHHRPELVPAIAERCGDSTRWRATARFVYLTDHRTWSQLPDALGGLLPEPPPDTPSRERLTRKRPSKRQQRRPRRG